MPDKQHEPISSPCIDVCAMSESTGLCLGCYRTLDEIRDWWDMTPDQRTQVMDVLGRRQAELANLS